MDDGVRLVDLEQEDRLGLDGDGVGEAPVELEVQGPGAGVQIQQGAGDELRALDVVEGEARAEEQVVLILVGCTAPGARRSSIRRAG